MNKEKKNNIRVGERARRRADLFDLAVLDEAGEAGVVDLAAVDWGALQRLVELETEKRK